MCPCLRWKLRTPRIRGFIVLVLPRLVHFSLALKWFLDSQILRNCTKRKDGNSRWAPESRLPPGPCLEFPLRAASAGTPNASPQGFVWAHAVLTVLISSNIGLSVQVSHRGASLKRKMKLKCLNIY